jgi:hypothetical protein
MTPSLFSRFVLQAFFAIAVTQAQAITITFSGNSPTSGTLGNTREFSEGGITVTASAETMIWNTPMWEASYLGLYATGLGVTNRLEGSGQSTYAVDSMGSYDRVVFSFSSPVILDMVGLSAVGDTDITAYYFSGGGWSILENNYGGTLSRTADINAGEVAASMWAVGALCPGNEGIDAFKINSITFSQSEVAAPVADSGDNLILLAITLGILAIAQRKLAGGGSSRH